MACHAVKRAVVGPGIDPPEAGTTDVGEPRTEAVAEQAEETEHHIRVGPGVGHDLRGLQLCLLFERDREQHQAVAQRPRDRNAVQAGELIGHEVVVGDARPIPKYLGLGPACTVRTGTTKRRPSAEATSPPPQARAKGIPVCAATRRAFAARKVSSRR